MANDFLPCKAMRDLLLPAYGPCPSFKGGCLTMRWQPALGHVPRGFCGALGKPQDVGLVLIVAEPGDPHGEETYLANTSAEELLSATTRYAYQCYESGKDQFHRNVRYILDLFWPGMTFAEQMRRTWITESVLCSAKIEGGSVPAQAWRQCVQRYLQPQLGILGDCKVLALGGKAKTRTSNVPNVVPIAAAAPPGCNRAGARESWIAAADGFRKGKVSGTGKGRPAPKPEGHPAKAMVPKTGRGNASVKRSSRPVPAPSPKRPPTSITDLEKLINLADELTYQESAIVDKLGRKILGLGPIIAVEGNQTYDLAFKSTRTPSFATFITHTKKAGPGWNRNDIPNTLVVQIKYKNVTDPDRIDNPRKWQIFGKPLDFKKGWFSFRVPDSKPDTIRYAHKLVKGAYVIRSDAPLEAHRCPTTTKSTMNMMICRTLKTMITCPAAAMLKT